MMTGGYTEDKEANDEIRTLCNEVKPHAEEKLGKTFDTWEPVTYKTQVVAGTNYKVKVKVGDNEHVNIKIHKALPSNGGEVKLVEALTCE
jgi:cystatin-A/B